MRSLFPLAAALLAAASPALAQQSPKPVSRADYLKTIDNHFGTVDTNHDGGLSKAELIAEQQRELQQGSAKIKAQLQQRFTQLDTNKDGQLSLNEFLAAAPPIRTAETADGLVQQLDKNRDGKISLDEFRAPQVAKFNQVDANHDGVVTPAEMKAAAGSR